MLGLQTEISVHYLIVGHTKFKPDAGFGLIKKAIQQRDIKYIAGLEQYINNSGFSNKCFNIADESNAVNFFDWKLYLRGKFEHIKFPRMRKITFSRVWQDEGCIKFTYKYGVNDSNPTTKSLNSLEFALSHCDIQ